MRRGGEIRRMRSREVQRGEIRTVEIRMMETVSAEIRRDKDEIRKRKGRRKLHFIHHLSLRYIS